MIPKIIFQKWETTELPDFLQELVNRWKQLNPDYQHVLFDTETARISIKRNFGDRFVDVFDKIVPGAFKADFWRYCMLYVHGGVYADIDMYCLGSLDALINGQYDLIAPIDLNINPSEGSHNVSNGFIMSRRSNPVMLEAILRIVSNVELCNVPQSPLDFSGPGLFGRAINSTLGRDEEESFVGMEGQVSGNDLSIKFLKFNRENEIMGDLAGNVILQNKNGIPDLQRKYAEECQRIGVKSWLNTFPIKTD